MASRLSTVNRLRMLGRLRDVSLRVKITLSFVLIVVAGTSVSTFIGSRIVTKAMLNEALKRVRHGLEIADILYVTRLADVRRTVEWATASEKLGEEATRPPAERTAAASRHLAQVLESLRQDNGLDFLCFVDRDGRMLRAGGAGEWIQAAAAATGPAMPSAAADDRQSLPSIAAGAMAGQVLVGTEILSQAALERAGLAPAGRAGLEQGRPGLSLVAAAPLRAGGDRPGGEGREDTSRRGGGNHLHRVLGVVLGGIVLNGKHRLADEIRDLNFGGFGGLGGDQRQGGGDVGNASIFMHDVRVATNVLAANGQRAVGTRAAGEVADAVLGRGQRWYGETLVVSGLMLAGYEPLRDHRAGIVGMLGVGMQPTPFLAVRTDMMLTFLVVAAFGVVVVLGLTYLITSRVIYPLEEMVKATKRIAAGDLDLEVEVPSRDEVGHLARSFNKMLASLKTMRLELEGWGRTLEEKVEARTEELVAVQTQMAQSEKLASLGRLAAGVAHEVNNPLGGILTFASLALEDCDQNNPLRQNLEIIVKQTERCRDIVKGLLDFARQGTSQVAATSVSAVIDKTLSLLEKQALFHNIRIVRRFADGLPEVLIDPGQMQQVVMNIVINAADAMEASGTLTVETALDRPASEVVVRIGDSGKGIPEGVIPFIFEPFFTTKKVGQGTGLGLAIVHGIVTRAGGKIEVATSSSGSTFTVRLPVASAASSGGRGSKA